MARSGRAAQEQGNLAISPGMFGKIIVDAKRVALAIAEIFAYGAAGIGSDVLRGCGAGRTGYHHDGVIHGSLATEGFNDLGDRGFLLPDGDINANHVATFLVKDGV